MKKFSYYSVIALLICAVAGIATVAQAAYSEKITTSNPCINIPRPKDDPRWKKAFTHWNNRKSTKEVMAALAIIESISKDKPNDVITNVWLTRVYFQAAMRNKKQREFYAKKSVAASEKALKKDPDNIYANYWHDIALIFYREPTEAEYKKIRAFAEKFFHLRDLPVPKDDPLWAKAMKLWDDRLTAADMKIMDAGLKGKKGRKAAGAAKVFAVPNAKGKAVIKIFEQLEKKYPDRIEPKLWLLKSHYWMTQINMNPRARAIWGKLGMDWGQKALDMEPQNPAANLYHALCIAEYGLGHSLTVLLKYTRQQGREIMLISEEDANYSYAGFSRFIAGSVAVVGDLVFRIADWLGFSRSLIERMATVSIKIYPKLLRNYSSVADMYNKLGMKDEVKKMHKIILESDPDAMPFQGSENRLVQFTVKHSLQLTPPK